jgi:hypothetical protein
MASNLAMSVLIRTRWNDKLCTVFAPDDPIAAGYLFIRDGYRR